MNVDDGEDRKGRLPGGLTLRAMAPNAITAAALCVGLTGIRFAIAGEFEKSVLAVLLAGLLDGIDGRIARLLKAQSRFGAELDSLADFVNFGVAPALILYFWELHVLKSPGWIAAMVFAICVLLPVYLQFLSIVSINVPPVVTLFYTFAMAGLMVSRLPVFSGKKVGTRVSPEMVLPVFVAVVAFCALFVSYPWEVLTVMTLAFLATLPLGWLSYQSHLRKDAEALAANDAGVNPANAGEAVALDVAPEPSPPGSSDADRPTRLN